MTTVTAAAQYLAQHLSQWGEKNYALYNPLNKPIEDLPVIMGFNNGGGDDWLYAQLIAQDGTPLGSHICSNEAYMPYDLGIKEGARSDRHEDFKKHYPDGYRMDFVSTQELDTHSLLQEAFRLNELSKTQSEGRDASITITLEEQK